MYDIFDKDIKRLLTKNGYIRVRNLNATSDKECPVCSSWLEHWKKLQGKNFQKCVAEDCSNNAEVGAHVKKVDSEDGKHYIVPFCKACNGKSSDDVIWVPKSCLASAEKCKN